MAKTEVITKEVYISKFAESQGVFKLEVLFDPKKPEEVQNPRQAKVFKKPDWSETLAEALTQAQRQLQQIDQQIAARSKKVHSQLLEIDHQIKQLEP